MRILVCNNRYFAHGGAETYLFKLMRLVEEHGHVAVPFSIRFAGTLETPFSRYFATPPLDPQFRFVGDRELSLGEKLRLAAFTIWNAGAFAQAQRVLEDEDIDLVFTIQVKSYLYSAVVAAAAQRSVPVVFRCSDYQLVCPAYTCLRDGKPCEACAGGLWHAVAHSCVKSSRLASAARVLGRVAERAMGADRRVSAFVSPTRFLRDALVRGRIPPSKIHVIPTFVDPAVEPTPSSRERDVVLYAGRLAPEKGVDLLIRAWDRIPHRGKRLLVAGTGEPEFLERVREVAAGVSDLELCDAVDGSRVASLLSSACALVVPSIWYENLPNSALEAMSHGVPVVAFDSGSMSEVVIDGETGLLARAGDVEDLARALARMTVDPAIARRVGEGGRVRARREHSSRAHWERLAALFDSCLAAPAAAGAAC